MPACSAKAQPATAAGTCPRCGAAFACGAALGEPTCACFGLNLGPALRAELAARWPGACLCLGCLRELIERDRPRPSTPA